MARFALDGPPAYRFHFFLGQSFMRFGRAECAALPRSSAFTLVELLVVLAVIGCLMAMLLPAVQAAREAARRIECQNHLKQLALAGQQHHDVVGCYPSGGWGYSWTGDRACGLGANQPGGWTFSTLPFAEQSPLYDTAIGLTGGAKLAAVARTASTPAAIFYCPTRRAVQTYPNMYGTNVAHNSGPSSMLAKTDYAANCGDSPYDQIDGGPSSFAAATTYAWPNTDQFTGVCSMRSEVRDRDITDGTSNTYYAGEKYLDPRLYTTGTDLGDNEDAFVGFDNDICRTASLNYPPMNDTPGIQNTFGFGSGHPAGLNMAFCDGSVRRVSYDIDPETHRRLANRRDGLFIDAGQLGR
jgi:prepilin-type N-terminal cleavage/methylation domain-containing protein/prepilin-type processing-associated H-X9-DG protein